MSIRVPTGALTAALMVCVLSLLLGPLEARATTASEAISVLNQQRAANGIPAVALDQSLLKSECTLQNHHVAAQGTGGWSVNASPWSNAPLHKSFIYDPVKTSASYGVFSEFKSTNSSFPSSEAEWQCMWFAWNWEATTETGNPHFYNYVGERGPSAAPYKEEASEWPFTPQQEAGLPSETPTGPSLLVYALGLGASPHILSASLESSSGQSVPVRSVDGTSRYEGQAGFFPWAGAVIPVNPLVPGTSYTANVVWSGAEGESTQTFSFTTEAAPLPAKTAATRTHQLARSVSMRIARVSSNHNSLQVKLKVSPVLQGRHVTLTVRPLRCRHVNNGVLTCSPIHRTDQGISVLVSQALKLPRPRQMPVELIIKSPAFTQRGVRYAAASVTKTIGA